MHVISNQQLTELRESLLFLYVAELKVIANKLALLDTGNKIAIITRILHFLQTGQKMTLPKFPAISCAQRGHIYPLAPCTLMLKNAYKNDLKTRLFFQQLLGDHFHFTAFGIDWLNEQWLNGNPPTYQQFATMWQTEYEKRKKTPTAPKEEWQYIIFIQHFLDHSPHATRDDLNIAWEIERQKHKSKINNCIFLNHQYIT